MQLTDTEKKAVRCAKASYHLTVFMLIGSICLAVVFWIYLLTTSNSPASVKWWFSMIVAFAILNFGMFQSMRKSTLPLIRILEKEK